MSYVITDARIGAQAITDVSTTAQHKVGTIVRAEDETYGAGEFVYLAGAADVARGSWVRYNLDDGGVTLLAADLIGPVAVAMAATVASTYGWYQIQGKAVALCLASFADNGNVYATSTAGSIDDAVVAGDLVQNAVGASNRATTGDDSGMAHFEIERPFITNDVDDLT